MSIADKAQAHALLVDGQEVPTAATRAVNDPATGEPFAGVADAKHVVFELTGAPRKEWYDAVSSPE